MQDVVQALIAAKADVNLKNTLGSTPLHFAAQEGCTETLEALIAAGADVNARNEDGNTPLHLAALNGRTEIVEILRAEMSYFPACTIL